jgi:dTDP-4-dehydrorhamnose reductase
VSRVLVIGGMGMLGHRLWIELSRSHEVWATVRDPRADLPDIPGVAVSRAISEVDVLDDALLGRAIERTEPEVIVNCVGIVKQSALMDDERLAARLNAELPHRLVKLARGARVIQISTDCVFDGRRGGYRESDPPSPIDSYGRTKLQGEIDAPSLTIRTSMIGRELRASFGLTEWFLSQRDAVRGFTRAIFSGLTTLELSRVIGEILVPRDDLVGTYHVAGPAISKNDLLHLLGAAYGHDVAIVPDDTVVIDRSLDASAFGAKTSYVAPGWEAMVAAMAGSDLPYDALRKRLRRSTG